MVPAVAPSTPVQEIGEEKATGPTFVRDPYSPALKLPEAKTAVIYTLSLLSGRFGFCQTPDPADWVAGVIAVSVFILLGMLLKSMLLIYTLY